MGLAGKVKYAQTLHDGARGAVIKHNEPVTNENLNPRFHADATILQLMSEPKDGMPIPVIECILQ